MVLDNPGMTGDSDSDYSDDEFHGLVLDNGTRMIKIGFAGEDAPSTVFKNMTGRPNVHLPPSTEDFFIGNKAQPLREFLSLEYPIEHGIVVDWDTMEKVWSHALSSCTSGYHNKRVNVDNLPILVTEPPLNPKSNRETMAEVMFEAIRRPAIDVVYGPSLATYANGRNTSLTVDIGDGVTSVYPIYDGHTPESAIMRSDLAGRDLTDFLMHDLNIKHGLSFSTASDREIVYEMKEKYCFVASEQEELLSKHTKSYELKNGETVDMADETLCKCPEILFNPEKYGFRTQSIQQLVYQSILNCDIHKRNDLTHNILLSGGTTLIPGFRDRLTNELDKILPPDADVRVMAPPERLYTVWIGGSILASLNTHEKMWITKEMYDEFGPSIVFRCEPEDKECYF